MRWLLHHFDRVDPEIRRLIAGYVFTSGALLWPISQFTFARHEPPVVLAISWLAIELTALDVICSTDVRKEMEQ